MSKTVKTRLSLTALEGRDLMSGGIGASLIDGVLKIAGTEGADRIYVGQTSNQISVKDSTTAVKIYNATQGVWVGSVTPAQVIRIEIDGKAGGDEIRLDQGAQSITERAILLGGSGRDTIYGGAGADVIAGGTGDDVLYGRGGNDALFGEAGSDYLSGDAGSDLLSAGYGVRIAGSVAAGDIDLEAATTTTQYDAVAERLWAFDWASFSASVDRISTAKAANFLWEYDWSRFVQCFESGHLSTARAGEILWAYSGDQFTQALAHLPADRLGQIIWTFDWTRFAHTLDRMSISKAGEVLRSYNWTDFSRSFDHLSASLGAEILKTYSPSRLAASMDHLASGRVGNVIWKNMQDGVIYYSAATGAHAILGDSTNTATFWGKFAESGYQTGMGLPTDDAYATHDGRTAQKFERGFLITKSNGSVLALSGAVGEKYALGGASKYLGLPVSTKTVAAGSDSAPFWGVGTKLIRCEKGTIAETSPGLAVIDLDVDLDYPQTGTWDCGVSSGARILRWYGCETTQSQFEDRVRSEGNVLQYLRMMGASPTRYAEMMESESLYRGHYRPFRAKTGASIQDIFDQVQKGKPVMALIRTDDGGFSFPTLHYVVVTGVNPSTQQLRYIDPWAIGQAVEETKSYAAFQKEWAWSYDGFSGAIVDNTGLKNRTIVY